MLANILIIDKRKELPIKYKKSLEDSQTAVLIAGNMKDALNKIQVLEPDMIIVSDSIDEELSIFCEKIRTLTYNIRPIIIALSKSADVSDRISVLESGADDFLSEPVNSDEFKTRIKAHLRRDIESNLDVKTLLPNNKMTLKTLKRILNSENKQATLLVSIENLENYKSVYSELAGDKIIQTLIAIIKSSISESDFMGQLNETNFIITTNHYSAEKLAEFLVFAFDTVVPKFYSETDVNRGYMLLKGEGQAEMRSDFVSILIGGILDNYNIISNTNNLLERLFAANKNAKKILGSAYMIDRLKLTGEISVLNPTEERKIYIKEPDNALYTLLRTTLELQGYDICDSIENETLPPKIIIIDSEDDFSGLELCKNLRTKNIYANTKIIMTTTIRDKTSVLNSGADLYLPKPYEIADLIKWVEYFSDNKIL
ncbi:MAG: response regulator [bacterium]|nr:response regulator [bacterium]